MGVHWIQPSRFGGSPPPGGVTITDTFNGSGTPAVTALAGTVTRTGGVAESSSGFGGLISYDTTLSTNHRARVTYDTVDVGEPMIFVANDGTYAYPHPVGYFVINIANGFDLYRRANGGAVSASLGTYTGTITANHEFRLQVIGGIVKFFVDGTERISYTDASPLTGTRVGFGWGYIGSGTSNAVADFVGEEIV